MVLRQQTDIIKGSRLMIFMEVLSELTPIGFATNHLFSKQLNTIEISSINDGSYNAILPQNYSWTMQTDNLYSINGYKLLHYAFKAKRKVLVCFGESNYNQTQIQDSIVDVNGASDWEPDGFVEQGYAYITSLEVTSAAGENATLSATFVGISELTESNLHYYDITKNGQYSMHFTVENSRTEVTKATQGTILYIIPDTGYSYNDHYLLEIFDSSLNEIEVTWDDTEGYWYFEMPASNVIISLIKLYCLQKSSDPLLNPDKYHFTDENLTEILDSTYLKSSTLIFAIPVTGYTYEDGGRFRVVNASTNVTWDSVNEYWYFLMPTQNTVTQLEKL